MKRYSGILTLWVLVVVGVTGMIVAAGSTAVAAEPVLTVTVDCTRGQTIARALTMGNESMGLIVVVRGTCNESVTIDRSDVTLRGEPGFGSAINGPDSATDTVTVKANLVTVENLEITGGRSGIVGTGAGGLLVQGVTVQSTGRNGIAYVSGSSGIIDGCTVQSNVRDGVVIESASATITNCNISQNRNGVVVTMGGSARIGLDSLNVPAANTISQNVQSGVAIAQGGQAIMAKNQITGNAFGVLVSQGTANIMGLNNISGNVGQGINATQATVQIGSPVFGFSTVNKIEGNGNATSPGGVFGFVGTAMVIRDAVISGNNGFGLILSLGSKAQLFSSTIQNNKPAGQYPGDGIRLVMGSGLFAAPGANSTVSGNTGWGLQCTDGESSVINTLLLGLSGNGAGDLSPSCTGF